MRGKPRAPGDSEGSAVYMSLPQHDLYDPDLRRLERQGAWPKPGEHGSVRSEAEEALFHAAL
eukprot:1221018-Pyramimonas_sp.AAC.1